MQPPLALRCDGKEQAAELSFVLLFSTGEQTTDMDTANKVDVPTLPQNEPPKQEELEGL